MQDELGERIKNSYENRTRFSLPRRTYTIIRLDGKAWHSFTKNLKKPFDFDLIEDLNNAVIKILPEIQGARFAYVQSDEISILLTDFEKPNTDAWFDGNIQKITSVSASLITAEFNKLRIQRNWAIIDVFGFEDNPPDIKETPMAFFDSRTFTIPDFIEVYNYLIWRWKDCARNSISMVAQSLYSSNELHEKNSSQKQEMIFSKGINWADYDPALKNGRLIVKEMKEEYVNEFLPKVMRQKWVVKPAWKFTEVPGALQYLIPKYN